MTRGVEAPIKQICNLLQEALCNEFKHLFELGWQ